MKAITGVAGLRGFDANRIVDARAAKTLHSAGYRFAVRYIPRLVDYRADLSTSEIETLFLAGLAVMPVQHVESESSWVPTDDKGRSYGEKAAQRATALGLASGTTVWLDLEGVSTSILPSATIRYCNLWHEQVHSAGFMPGLYVGWRAGVGPEDLYSALRFTRYWAAYNLNLEQYPIVRGVCMKQSVTNLLDRAHLPFEIDSNTIRSDLMGGLPMLSAPDEWDTK